MHESRLASARLYLCTDARRERGDLAQFAEAALAGGVDIIQLRDKGSPGELRFGPLQARDELAACEILADAAHRYGALFAVNDRADIARAAGADVLHLGQRDLPVNVARQILAPDTLIGRSTHDPDQVAAAAAGDADYFCVGPCWPTLPSGRAAPLGLVRVAAELGGDDKPWFAIGGINAQRLPAVLDAGASASWWCGRSPRLTTHVRRPSSSGRRLQQRTDPPTQRRGRLIRVARRTPEENPGLDLNGARQPLPPFVAPGQWHGRRSGPQSLPTGGESGM
ncbi:thiamine-phosphate pyrophosphorylase [Mycobacterium tuberculosis CAS/NITR204]|uniref:Thiamine-phosphate synthase n=11 Tax=Mycobacterium tuberculosis TaxID=1773 RepID=R4M2L1_MYCTX|nr:thiamine-phosphate pyrophosphorylase [Mycobacterium tuberculosis CAS/NITR204]